MIFFDLRGRELREWPRELKRSYTPSLELMTSVQGILAEVRSRGESGLLAMIEKFDRAQLSSNELKVTPREIEEARGHLDPALHQALLLAKENVQEFGYRSRRTDWLAANRQGAEVGERFDPFRRVGIYVPAGSVPLVSSAIMTVSLAEAIGVPEIVVVSPVGPDKKMNGALLSALEQAGATEIYKAGGAQAIGALAFGTESIRPVQKIFGPGNAYVTEAKRQVFGFVAIDLMPGPSEILVVADETANPEWVAADLLAQAEHGRTSVVAVVATSRVILEKVEHAVESTLGELSRSEILREVLEKNAHTILVEDLSQAVKLIENFAPEHLNLAVANAREIAALVRNTGAIFIGNYSAVAAGDFVAGPSHELPTGGAGKSFGGLTVDQFQRRTSIVEYTKETLFESWPAIMEFSKAEQLDAHGRSVAIRFGQA